ncbi:MAG: acyl-CoA dehydrogenase family protein [Myxococcales bacterium]|jgi:glutaryl-CoA dehydrogenase|nr:acyl-CoA dehydrogenase family protein [Myxococcales bacterium]MBL9113356.1 acyl-CoA dehydrogenase family protein [Myxococcales bacterium]
MPDFFDISRHLTDEEKAIKTSVRKFVDARVLPTIGEHFEKGTFPVELIPEIADLGLLGCNLQGYGCAGLSDTGYGVAMAELERGDSGIRSFASVQGSLAMYPIHTWGSEEQKQKYLPEMAKGKIIGCFGLTEPDWGSNPAGMITTAVDDGDSYVLNGTKRWITNGNLAQVAIVWAKMGNTQGEVRGFVVPTDTKGFEARLIHKKMSLRASVTSELILEDVRIPKSAMLPGVRGMKGPLSTLTSARFGIAWGVLGAAEACFDCALDYAKNRVQFGGKPIASHQLVQAKFAEMLTQISAGQLMVLEVSRLKAEKKMIPQHVSMIKRHNVRTALETARACRDILGGNGITLEYPIMRHLCNLETVYTYEGTHDVHSLVLGQHVTGINAFG